MKKPSVCDIVVGIPTYNEADSIGLVVREIDAGLKPYLEEFSAIIINADNNSPDNTRQAFLNVKTDVPKLCVTNKERGKGVNVLSIFKKASALKAKAVLIFDGDLESITPSWIQKYADATLSGYDFVSPLYARNEYDGSITNHICYPFLAAVFSTDLRQPIGGDFALSGFFAKELASRKWKKNILKYGVDIFLTVSAIAGRKKIAQAFLGSKEHKPSLPKLGPMYSQVTNTLFKVAKDNKGAWGNGDGYIFSPPSLYGEKVPSPQDLAIDYKYLKTRALYEFSIHHKTIRSIVTPPLYKKISEMYFKDKKIRITSSMWTDIMAFLFKKYLESGRSGEKIVDAGRPLYFGRQTTFIKDTIEMGHLQSEEKIIAQMKNFYKNRHKFLTQ